MSERLMKYRSWHLLSVAFGALMVVLVGSGVTLANRTTRVRDEIASIQRASQKVEVALTGLREQVFSLALFTRDYLMHRGPIESGADRREMLSRRTTLLLDLERLAEVIPATEKAEINRVEDIVLAYLRSTNAVFTWTEDEKRYFGPQYIRDQLTPQRDALLRAIAELNEIYRDSIDRRQASILGTQQLILDTTRNTVLVAVALSVLIALYTIVRLHRLEVLADRHREELERDQEHLRRLSQEMVRAQEAERKSLSRELHDQVGQTLTALRLEIGNLGSLRLTDGPDFAEHLDAAKQLSEQALHTVRDLSMGLRPSMLDDLGLEPALRWQARNFSRSSRIPVDVNIEGEVASLPEPHRISIFRIVQEALTNCAKHSRASGVRITLHGGPNSVSLTVQDDGQGFTPGVKTPKSGVGLIGIEERVRELGGRFSIYSAPERGTLLLAELPLEPSHEQDPHPISR